jgi:NAD-dependent SIR2 family protein deacetylase
LRNSSTAFVCAFIFTTRPSGHGQNMSVLIVQSIVTRVSTVNIIDDQMHGRLIGVNKSIEVHGRVNSQKCNRCALIAGHVLKMCS